MRVHLIVALLLASVVGASAGDYAGQPTCDFCEMLITEKAFGGRLTTTRGKTLVFDATECMAAFSLYKMKPPEIGELQSVNHERPSDSIDAKRAAYLQSDKRLSPMGLNLSAYASRDEAERARSKVGGEVLSWDQVLKLVRKRWYRENVD